MNKNNIWLCLKNSFLLFAVILSIFSSTVWAMTDDLSDIEKRQTAKNKNGKKCLDNCGDKSDGNIIAKKDSQDKNASNRLWYDGRCCSGGCSTQVNTHPTSQGEHDEEISRYKIFSSSFINGAAYTLVPELIRDALEFKGYSRASNIVSTIVQSGMIIYNTSSYAPVVTGTIVRIGFRQLGFSQQDSNTAGITVAIVTTLTQKLIFSEETALDCIVDVALGVGGSYMGSTLALKAKSWVYQLFGYKKPVICENVQ
ncbi:MAG: hypothetical protein K2X02_09800 [Alphaproteobacteria bacterium]|nr:hypothetical protein [Alphaproteobacteria bacterium]